MGEFTGNNLTITADPESPVVGTSCIMLGLIGLNGNSKLYTFAWNCSKWAFILTLFHKHL